MITIFTDGSSRGNPGPGGWGTVLVARKKAQGAEDEMHVIELGGGDKNTTNNRMELTAAVKGLAKTPTGADVTVYTDSSYVINGITKWIHGWMRNHWQTQTKQDVLNKELWMDLHDETKSRTVKWQYVGGHVGILGNERCDHIATAFADSREIDLFSGKLADYDLPRILDISLDENLAVSKKSDSSRAKAKAYSYLSAIGGVVEVHKTWAECEKRVKGVKGARFKKALDRDEEQRIIAEFQAL